MPAFHLAASTSLHTLPLAGTHVDQPELHRLEELIEFSARLLPAEGPISGFVFQNPLHAFEGLTFHDAVRQASHLFGCRGYLTEERYREELARGRIQVVDLRSALEQDEGSRPWEMVGGLVSRLDLRLRQLLTPMLEGTDEEIEWVLTEEDMLTRFRSYCRQTTANQIVVDVKRWAVRDLINPENPSAEHLLRSRMQLLDPIMNEGSHLTDKQVDTLWEHFALHALWEVCSEGVSRAMTPVQSPRKFARPRDLLLAATGVDADELVHGALITFCAAFCDQGLAHDTLPDRDEGFFRSFCRLFRKTPRLMTDRWRRDLPALLAEAEASGSAMASIRLSIDALGISEAELEEFLPATMVALRGWGSMIRQMEARADRFARPAPRGTLMEFLAVRLLLDRLALAHVAREELNYRGPVSGLQQVAEARLAPNHGSTHRQQTFILFQLAQAYGWQPSYLHKLSSEEWGAILKDIQAFDSLARERIFHQAYERRYTVQALDAIAARVDKPLQPRPKPEFQAAFCIDTRETAFARHLEEAAPQCETYGLPGFFCVPMYYKGIADSHAVPSCPIIVRPQNWVKEEPFFSEIDNHDRSSRLRRKLGLTTHRFSRGTHTLGFGAVYTSALGLLTSLLLVTRVLFPRWSARMARMAAQMVAPPSGTRLTAEHIPSEHPHEPDHGFTLEERVAVAEKVLNFIGLTRTFSRLVFLFGHGSQGINNPHLSAYNCGACSGNSGGPNARLLTAFLNDLKVRAVLAERGLAIPEDTIFIGGQHNTGDDTFVYYDLDLLPRSHWKEYEAARNAIQDACGRNARERCRRFESAPLNISEPSALVHVQGRTHDLAQVRPEFGNATNALCIIGRKARVRGLFLDRRSFYHSYDPTQDDEVGTILAKILAPTVPVCQGINLEYYFSAVDPAGWGAGTKLPHNVTALLGVMDGAASDLRQGLPWQGVEIHEPMRLLFVIETTPSVMKRIMEQDSWVGRILKNEWAQLAVLDPHSAEMCLFQNGQFHRYHPTERTLPSVNNSAEWYSGRRDPLGFATIEGEQHPAATAS